MSNRFKFGFVEMAIISISCSFAFGSSFYLVNTYVAPKLRSRSFILTGIAQTGSYFLVVVVCMSFTIWLSIYAETRFVVGPFHPDVMKALSQVLSLRIIHIAMLGAYMVALLISGFFQINAKLGPGVLLNWLTGKYHEPREEERIFMFLDLKGSTTLAEKMGNLKYSAMVRDFFSDLTFPAMSTKTEVSHYVGDEAVLTWRPDRGIARANCILFFFKMQEAIAKRRGHYMEKYGIVPEFKAGVHIGPVVATEVGELKSEIVYHGDVLNTTARIQSVCNDLESELLVSGDLMARLELPPHLHAVSKGRHLLKGKEQDVEIFSVGPVVLSETAKMEEMEGVKV